MTLQQSDANISEQSQATAAIPGCVTVVARRSFSPDWRVILRTAVELAPPRSLFNRYPYLCNMLSACGAPYSPPFDLNAFVRMVPSR